MSFITSVWRHYRRWIVSVLLLLFGLALVWLAKGQDGWSQSALIELGAAIALLGPLYFLEELLQGSVKKLSQQVEDAQRSYAAVRSQLPRGRERTLTLDGILDDVTAAARQGQVSEEDLSALSRVSGDPTMALAAMLGDHRLIEPDVIVESIDHSKSGMEQFYALRLANEGWPSLPPVTKQVVQAIERDRHGRMFIAEGTNRDVVARRILDIARQEGTL